MTFSLIYVSFRLHEIEAKECMLLFVANINPQMVGSSVRWVRRRFACENQRQTMRCNPQPAC